MNKQYCRYCAFCIDGDAIFCTAKEKVLSESRITMGNHCKDFELSELGDVITGEPYIPRQRHSKTITGQITM